MPKMLVVLVAAGAVAGIVTAQGRDVAPPAPGALVGLMASGPAADVADKMMLFGRLVGSWDIDYTAFLPEGKRVTAKCEWHFAWVLAGRAVQDVWICPSRAERARDPRLTGEWGTTVRVYDKKLDAWHVVFFGPAFGNVNLLVARQVGGEIIQEGRDSAGRPIRWNFDGITTDAFRWWSETSRDSGRTWIQQEEMRARRRGGGGGGGR